MTVAPIPSGKPSDLNRTFTGWSDQPIAVDDQIIEAEAQLKEAASNLPVIPALMRLQSIVAHFSIKNWDEYGALPVSGEAYEEAEDFIFLLADGGLPMPDISPEVDGGIEFEWYMSSDHIFTVSFNGKKILGYSGMFGEGDTFYGTSKINSEIPDIIRWNISKFTKKKYRVLANSGNDSE